MTLAMKTRTTKLIQTTQMKIIRRQLVNFNQSPTRKGNLCWSRILILSHSGLRPRIIGQFLLVTLAYSSFIRAVDMTKLYDRKIFNQFHKDLKTQAVRSVSLRLSSF